MSSYDHKDIEKRWAERWQADKTYKAEDFSKKPKKYILAEFPYPSGTALHAGHMMRYTVPDVYSRYLRMKGFNVLFPIGWDAFGLPAESFAVKSGVHPAITTRSAIDSYKDSIRKMGYGIDWDREIDTTDPSYYKWTQWLFLKFFQKGLAEYREMPIWWCEQLRTVLSDEEVLTDKDGNKISERGEYPVERKMLKQWVLKITEYADKLLEGLDEIDFPESIKTAQRSWIGRSYGANVSFPVGELALDVFTTRPDTIFGVTYMAISPESTILEKLLENCENKDEVEKYISGAKKRSDLEKQKNKDKTGVLIKGVFAKHPVTGKDIPLYTADYVLMDYGTGVIMGVPAHDERDNEFAKKLGIEILPVIETPSDLEQEVYTGTGKMINSGAYDGMDSKEFSDVIIERFEKEGIGKRQKQYKLRDWIFSRQRYWGEPIPLIHTEDGQILAICDVDDPEDVNDKLPLELPELPDYTPSSDGASPLGRNKDWVNTTDRNGNPAKRETNTMPNWAGSCWYFIRYADPKNDKAFADPEKMKYWLPVDRYFGGAEHTTMHLLYSRFWYKFLSDQGLVPTSEPYMWRMNGGLLLGPDGTKMSKSKGNVIEPMDIVENYGADALRSFICFLGPYTDT
jgi:leucyl-tRNA synthetase